MAFTFEHFLKDACAEDDDGDDSDDYDDSDRDDTLESYHPNKTNSRRDKSKRGKWQWLEETTDEWNDYDQSCTDEIESGFLMGKDSIDLSKGFFASRKGEYFVSISKQMQYCKANGNYHSVRRVEIAKKYISVADVKPGRWEWFDQVDKDTWIAYDKAAAEELEKGYLAGDDNIDLTKGFFAAPSRKGQYYVCISKTMQYCKYNQNFHRIRRVTTDKSQQKQSNDSYETKSEESLFKDPKYASMFKSTNSSNSGSNNQRKTRFLVSDSSVPSFVKDRTMADKALLWNTGSKLTVLEQIYGKSSSQKKQVWRTEIQSLIAELEKYSYDSVVPIFESILKSDVKLSKDFPFAAEVIHIYTLEKPDIYKQLNLSLRKAAHNKSKDYKLMRYCTALNVSLMSCNEYRKATYRAAALTQSDIGEYRKNAGLWFFWPEFVSTTKQISLALSWIRDYGKNVLFKVICEAAQNSGRDISVHSKFKSEEEILYPSHSWYTVKRVYKHYFDEISQSVFVIEISYHSRSQ